MDLLKLIIDADRLSATCFLCFKLCDNGTNLFENIYMEDTSLDFAVKTSLSNVIKYLFPSETIISSKACEDCAEDLKKIYFKLQARSINIENLNHIVNIINSNISGKLFGDCSIQIKMPVPQKQINNDAISNQGSTETAALNDQTCNFNFIHKKLNTEHKQTQNNSCNSEICHICGKNCENPKSLKSHLNCHNKKECPYCKKILKTHSHFNKHLKSHQTNVRRKRKTNLYLCDSCPYKSLNKTDLLSHINKAHLGIRPYQCEICLKSFHKKSNLTAHISGHDRKKLICEICGNNFSFKKTLIQHLKLHEGVRNYECEQCKRKFVTLSRKNEHIRRTHSSEHLNCLFCEKKYALKKDLNSHMKKNHCDVILNAGGNGIE